MKTGRKGRSVGSTYVSTGGPDGFLNYIFNEIFVCKMITQPLPESKLFKGKMTRCIVLGHRV